MSFKSILVEFMNKRGVKDVNKLTPEEKAQFDEWDRILSLGDITVDSIKEFCENQIKRIEATWMNLDNADAKNAKLVTQHSVYSTLLKIITGPKAQKEALEKYLVDQIK